MLGRSSATTVSVGNWQHVVYVINSESNTHKIYVDNVLKESQSISYFPSSVVRHINWIGSSGSAYLNGKIKSFNIWERALVTPEINTYMDMVVITTYQNLVVNILLVHPINI